MNPTRRISFAALAAGLCLVFGASACSSDGGASPASAQGTMSVERATIDWPANPSTAAVRMVVRNGTDTADALTGVSSPVAASATIHRSETDAEGRSIMTPQDELPLAARSSVTFEPSGLHVMLTGITADLQVGDDVELTLSFARAPDLTVTATVVEPGTADESDDHDH